MSFVSIDVVNMFPECAFVLCKNISFCSTHKTLDTECENGRKWKFFCMCMRVCVCVYVFSVKHTYISGMGTEHII